MNRFVLILVSFVLAGASPLALAKEGVIVQGENGTKWCCPKGEKGPDCEKGASTIPVGARCNFASLLVPVDPATPVKPVRPVVRGEAKAAAPRAAAAVEGK
ncbi:hypothetical protein [Pseudomonas sp. CGJS7]|uniref:hypothetical protein n=1 Tax=Pseudomonas sp. CGJS7 TaxID=3109348 RepID=UPI00300A6B5D